MRLDASLGFDPPLADVPSIARAAEAAGVDGLWSADVSHDPFAPLVLAAEHTERLSLGTAVAVAFARSPLAMAMTAWDLARLSRGRFILGLGSQVRAHVERRFGMAWSGRPVAQLREYVSVLRTAWDTWQHGSRPSVRGEFYRFTLMTPAFDPGPNEHPDIPVYLAGVGPGMIALAGEVGDGLIVHPLHSRAYVGDVVLPAVHEGARRAGRPADAVIIAASVVCATSDEEVDQCFLHAGLHWVNARRHQPQGRGATIHVAHRVDVSACIEEHLGNPRGVFRRSLPVLFHAIRSDVEQQSRVVRAQ